MYTVVRHVRANVIAYLALFVALGGTSFAATTTLSKNSVGSKQIKTAAVGASEIKNNAITSTDVHDGALLTKDFKASELASLKGPKGDTGDKGDKGDPGTPATKLFAHVTSLGTLTAVKSGATAATRLSTGNYVVTFDRSLVGCVAFAEIGFVSGVSGSLFTGTVVHTSTSPSGVTVQLVRGDNIAAVDGNFNVAVFC
jgi:hypothetical protein